MATGSTTSPQRDDQGADRSAVLPTPREAPETPSAPSRVPTWRRLARHVPRYTWSGTVAALLAGCSSFTPSLLPRGWLLQALIAGITAAIGYGVGVFVAWFVLTIAGRRPGARVQRRAWQVLAVLAPVLVWSRSGSGTAGRPRRTG